MDQDRKRAIYSHVKALHKEFTAEEISEIVGETPQYVRKVARELGVKCLKEKQRLVTFLQEYKDLSPNDLAKMSFYTPERIKQVAKEMGIKLASDNAKRGPKSSIVTKAKSEWGEFAKKRKAARKTTACSIYTKRVPVWICNCIVWCNHSKIASIL